MSLIREKGRHQQRAKRPLSSASLVQKTRHRVFIDGHFRAETQRAFDTLQFHIQH
jgi:hypothetical protein